MQMVRAEKMGADAIVRGRQICLVKMPEPLQRNIRQAFPAANNGIFVLESEGDKKVIVFR